MMSGNTTEIEKILPDLDAGLFAEKLGAVLSECALNTVLPDIPAKKSTVTVVFEIKQIGNSSQVAIDHTIKWEKPTKRGSYVEKDKTTSALFVNRGGKLTFQPEVNVHGQMDFKMDSSPTYDKSTTSDI